MARHCHTTGVIAALLAVAPAMSRAKDPPPLKPHAAFALIIGVNSTNDPKLSPLHYADDDAARFFDLFTVLGADTYLLTSLDENTARLHPAARAAAYPPDMRTLRVVVGQMALDIERARRNDLVPIVYVIYAGHGSRRGERARLTLEGSELPSSAFYREVLRRLAADRTHLIVDACHAEQLVSGRGPGGERFAVEGFAADTGLDRDPSIGLLIATSTSAESHEWERFQAGVFSHEVRSGLYGAADVDQDGKVSYREIAAFVERANSAVPNERYRPRVLARPPLGTEILLAPTRPTATLAIDGATHHGHHVLEDATGVRLLEFNNAPGLSLSLRRLAQAKELFLRRVGSETEYRIPATDEHVRLADLTSTTNRSTSRGAKHEAFELLFAAPLDADQVATVRLKPPPPFGEPGFPLEAVARWTAAGGAATLLVTGAVFTSRAARVKDQIPASAPQSDVAERQAEIEHLNSQAMAFYAGGALLSAVATWMFLSEE